MYQCQPEPLLCVALSTSHSSPTARCRSGNASLTGTTLRGTSCVDGVCNLRLTLDYLFLYTTCTSDTVVISRSRGYREDHQKVYARIPSALSNGLKSVAWALASLSAAVLQFLPLLAITEFHLPDKWFECLDSTHVGISDKLIYTFVGEFYFVILICQASLSIAAPGDLFFRVLYSSWPLSSVNCQSSSAVTLVTHFVPWVPLTLKCGGIELITNAPRILALGS